MNQSDEGIDTPVPDNERGSPTLRSQRIIRLSLAALASLLSFFLAWPWWRDFSYWAESHTMWAVYFIAGFILAVYVFYAFFSSLRTLFEHDVIERAELASEAERNGPEGQP